MKPIIEIRNASVRYRTRLSWIKKEEIWALRDISLSIHRGESLGIIGKNGSGKSTLLRLLAGIISPDFGEVIIKDIRVGLLALQIGFIPNLSGHDNIFLSGMLLGMDKKKIQKRYKDIVDFSELGDRIYDPVRTYSAGMRARLGFSIAIQLETDVLLIDEVFAVGDIHFRKKATEALKTKLFNKEVTSVIVSHHRNILNNLCDRIIVLENGKISKKFNL